MRAPAALAGRLLRPSCRWRRTAQCTMRQLHPGPRSRLLVPPAARGIAGRAASTPMSRRVCLSAWAGRHGRRSLGALQWPPTCARFLRRVSMRRTRRSLRRTSQAGPRVGANGTGVLLVLRIPEETGSAKTRPALAAGVVLADDGDLAQETGPVTPSGRWARPGCCRV